MTHAAWNFPQPVVDAALLADAADIVAEKDSFFSILEVEPSDNISVLSEALHIPRVTFDGDALIGVFKAIVGDADGLDAALSEPVTAALYDRAGKLFSDPLAEIKKINGGESSNLNAKVLYIPGDPTLPRPALVATTHVGKTEAGACAWSAGFFCECFYLFFSYLFYLHH